MLSHHRERHSSEKHSDVYHITVKLIAPTFSEQTSMINEAVAALLLTTPQAQQYYFKQGSEVARRNVTDDSSLNDNLNPCPTGCLVHDERGQLVMAFAWISCCKKEGGLKWCICRSVSTSQHTLCVYVHKR